MANGQKSMSAWGVKSKPSGSFHVRAAILGVLLELVVCGLLPVVANEPAALVLLEQQAAKGDWKAAESGLLQLLSEGALNPSHEGRARASLVWVQHWQSGKQLDVRGLEALAGELAASRLTAFALQREAADRVAKGQPDYALTLLHHVDSEYKHTEWGDSAALTAAQLHAKLGQHREAIESARRLADANPPGRWAAPALYLSAWAERERQNNSASERLFERLCNEHHESDYARDAAYRLADDAFTREDFPRAEKFANLAVSGPAEISARARFLLGKLAAQESNWPRTAEQMRQVVTQSSETALRQRAEFWLAEALFRQDQLPAALDAYEAFSATVSPPNERLAETALLRQAQILGRLDRWSDAFQRLDGFETLYPQSDDLVDAFYLRGRSLARIGRLDDARVAFRLASGDPVDPKQTQLSAAQLNGETAVMAAWMIGETFLHQNRPADALAAFSAAAKRAEQFPRWKIAAALQAGKCCEALGRDPEAVAWYETAATNDSRSASSQPFADLAAEQLSQLNRRLELARSAPSRPSSTRR